MATSKPAAVPSSPTSRSARPAPALPTIPQNLALGGLRTSTIYQAGIQLTLPLRNRIAASDAARDTVQLRQSEARTEKLANQAREEIETAADRPADRLRRLQGRRRQPRLPGAAPRCRARQAPRRPVHQPPRRPERDLPRPGPLHRDRRPQQLDQGPHRTRSRDRDPARQEQHPARRCRQRHPPLTQGHDPETSSARRHREAKTRARWREHRPLPASGKTPHAHHKITTTSPRAHHGKTSVFRHS